MVGEKGSEGAKRDGDAVKACEREKERGRREGKKSRRKKDGGGEEETSTVRACYFSKPFPFLLFAFEQEREKRKSSHRFQEVSLPF